MNGEETNYDVKRLDLGDEEVSLDDETVSLEDPPTVEEVDEDHCSICLQLVVDRTVIPECSHEFCFDCLLTWTSKNSLSLLLLVSGLSFLRLKTCPEGVRCAREALALI